MATISKNSFLSRPWLLILGWVIIVLSLLLYSFTQVDLGLTLTRASWWQSVQRSFQHIGYFQRPLSSFIYFVVLTLLFIWYGFILRAIKNGRLSGRSMLKMILFSALVLAFSYNAFSYDLFNYVFDAKIVTFYKQNPYFHKALDFPQDPMLGFMHWTHRLYPYGPLWLAVSIPLSFLGFQKLLPTLILFKLLAVTSYLASCLAIWKLCEKKSINDRFFAVGVFAFCPLVIIEGLVSAHNDIFMMAIGLLGFYFFWAKKYWIAFVLILLSAAVKFVTILLLLPLLLAVVGEKMKQAVSWKRIYYLSFVLMILAVIAAMKRDELKPWYLLYPAAFLPFVDNPLLFGSMIGVFFGVLTHYLAFFYFGNWDPPVFEIKMFSTAAFLIIGFLIGLVKQERKNRKPMLK